LSLEVSISEIDPRVQLGASEVEPLLKADCTKVRIRVKGNTKERSGCELRSTKVTIIIESGVAEVSESFERRLREVGLAKGGVHEARFIAKATLRKVSRSKGRTIESSRPVEVDIFEPSRAIELRPGKGCHLKRTLSEVGVGVEHGPLEVYGLEPDLAEPERALHLGIPKDQWLPELDPSGLNREVGENEAREVEVRRSLTPQLPKLLEKLLPELGMIFLAIRMEEAPAV